MPALLFYGFIFKKGFKIFRDEASKKNNLRRTSAYVENYFLNGNEVYGDFKTFLYFTSMPIERAVPATIRSAAASDPALRSGILVSAISVT